MAAETQAVQLMFKGFMKGHADWVSCLATSAKNPDMIVSGSRDKTLIVWQLTREQGTYGFPKKVLEGHQHIVSDCVISMDGQFGLSSSWDKTLKLWNLSTGQCTRTFQQHTADVMSVAFSLDNRQIVSAGRDKNIMLWNTLGECKYKIEQDGHNATVSKVRISPSQKTPIFVSGGWDKTVKLWNLTNCAHQKTFEGHKNIVTEVALSPDGSLCASADKDGMIMLWNIQKAQLAYSLNAGEAVNCLAFSPSRYWLCAATKSAIKIYNLRTNECIVDLVPEAKNKPVEGEKKPKKEKRPACCSLAWSADGSTLFSGYTDGVIRVWSVMSKSK